MIGSHGSSLAAGRDLIFSTREKFSTFLSFDCPILQFRFNE